MAVERVTITLPAEIVRAIDRVERNRSKFVATAVLHELERLHREALKQSLLAPHPEVSVLADEGLAEWAADLPAEEASDLVDIGRGTPVRWMPGQGWLEGAK